MNENPFQNLPTNQEKLDIKVKVAGPEDWQALKEIRMIAINSKDAKMFGAKMVAVDKTKTDEDWKLEVSLENKDFFYILFWQGKEVIGMGRAKYYSEDDVWYLSSAYTKEGSRGKVLPQKAFTEFINEIKRRGGRKVALGVRVNNKRAIKLYEILGFKKAPYTVFQILRHPINRTRWQEMEMDLATEEKK